MLAAFGPESIREPEEIFLVDRVQHHDRRPLDDFVFQSDDRERALSSVRLRYISSPGRLRSVGSSVDPIVQILDLAVEVCLVVLPYHAVYAGSRVSLEGEERQPEHFDCDVVEERGEPFLLPLLCCFPYTIQRL